ncbi:MAG: hypothetical protein AAGG75_17440 [Bacteroidota bacterium]
MKPLTFIIALLFFSFAALAQIQVEVAEEERAMNLGLNMACIITLENASEKDAEKTWTKFMKRYGKKTKKVKKSDEYLTDNATVNGMSNNTVDVYATFDQQGDDVELSVWYDLGGAYLSSNTHPDRFEAANKMLNDYANQMAKQAVERELENQEKSLKAMAGDLKKMQKDKTSMENDISKYEKKIEEAKAGIAQNLKDQEAKAAQIKGQENIIGEVKKRLKKFN